MNSDALISEWTLLQNQFDSYEKYSLVIKLTSLIIFSGAYMVNQIGWVLLVLLAAIWLQDAIWKTFQSRIDIRLLLVETWITENDYSQACQFNRQFAQARLSGFALIKEYIKQAIRPTTAFLHAILCSLTLVLSLF
ncbi:hypothetical protein [Catenovulum adriaticum]|uniref:Uncharacterized protein n=1 Tax=Catenovulum adriaticum TaxID=2984846 RepID=A0ABY7ALA7_9ALTE|nr:hypothetical protein [Catenovulum sp. TS8]WAJ70080.1 hypothetical protein OLW01_13185 [Catenovulum sp. TS8]